jgi:uncharacterized membrane protein
MQNPPPNQQDYGYNKPYGTPPNAPLAPVGGAKGKSTVGDLDANVAALLSYILTWLSGLVFYLMEKDNRFVRFHAMQSILLGATVVVILIVFSVIYTITSYISWILGSLFGLLWLLVWLVFLAAWIMCMVKAYQGQQFKLPLLGDIAENIINK